MNKKELSPKEMREERVKEIGSRRLISRKPGGCLTYNGRLEYSEPRVKGRGLIDKLLRRFVTSQKIKTITNRKYKTHLTTSAIQYDIVMNAVEFKLFGVAVSLKYEYKLPESNIELKAKVYTERRPPGPHIKNDLVSKEEYVAYLANKTVVSWRR